MLRSNVQINSDAKLFDNEPFTFRFVTESRCFIKSAIVIKIKDFIFGRGLIAKLYNGSCDSMYYSIEINKHEGVSIICLVINPCAFVGMRVYHRFKDVKVYDCEVSTDRGRTFNTCKVPIAGLFSRDYKKREVKK